MKRHAFAANMPPKATGKARMGRDIIAGIAVVGMGPRGLGALEALAAAMQEAGRQAEVDVFDAFPAAGAGPNFDPEESPVCRLNIPMRDIEIRPPENARCGSFADWLEDAPGPDAFPRRAELGRYLEARYRDLRTSGILNVRHISKEVERVRRAEQGWMLECGGLRHGPYSEVLLVLGQPETRPDTQLAEWQRHDRTRSSILAQAYPAHQLQSEAAGWGGKTVAIRGMALSAFDVLRVLTSAQGGRFEGGRYLASGREPARILPFSLDGMPPFPKPETEALDRRFAPTPAETETFSASMSEAATASPERARELVTAALLPPVIRILQAERADADRRRAATWLDTEWDASGTQETGGPLESLRLGIDMATGRRPASIGYIFGQVWRKWQNPLRSGFNPERTPPETAERLVGFDEGLKRYSYGPPVSSSRELSALIEAGLVDLDIATDPVISLTETGWQLRAGSKSAEASVMIDAVLPSPDLDAVIAPLVEALRSEGWLSALSGGLAAETAADGRLIGRSGDVAPGLCLLGRLALGSVIAADSLHDCFGEASRRWACGVVSRIVRARSG